MAVVARFNITPVSSTALLHPEELDLRVTGAVGDRRFMILEADWRRLSTPAKGPFLGVRTTFDPAADRLVFEFPDGERVEGDAAGTGEPRQVQLYDRWVEARAVDGTLAAEISRYAGREMILARVEEPEYAGGINRLTLLSIASVEDLGRRGGSETMPDPRRFRMIVELDGCEPYEEDEWPGRLIRLGNAVARVVDLVARCDLTTMNPDSGEKDFPTLKVLGAYRRRQKELPMGVHADIETPGRVVVGDVVEPI